MYTVVVVLVSWFALSLLTAAALAAWWRYQEARWGQLYPVIGTRRDGGSDRPSASTGTKEPGTPTPATATTEGCSSSSARGAASVVWGDPIWSPLAGSYIVRGLSTVGTIPLGVSGVPLGSAD